VPACTVCDDSGWKTNEVEGVSRVSRCDCWRQATAERASSSARIPPRYRKCDLENFQDLNDSLFLARRAAQRFAGAFPVVDKGLLLVGRPGVGKTHLAIGCLKLVIERIGVRGLFFDTRELLRKLRETYDPVSQATEASVLRPILDAELLVLDDLGAEKTSEWVEETLNLVVNTRYNHRRPTVFTTNYPIKAPEDAKHAETLIERVGFRMQSRLYEMCDLLELEGPDYRELGPNPSAESLVRIQKQGSATHKTLPSPGPRAQARARLRRGDTVPEIKWPGGRAGTKR
jgi:DNA replication protein DnaC